jgi:DNA replication protein DnaC
MPIGVDPKAIEAWRVELAAWNAANPERQSDYVRLLEEWDAYDAAQADRHAGAAALTRAGVPSRVLAAAMAARDTPAVALAREWLAGSKPWLVLMGGTGVGKSVAAAVALAAASKARQSCLWVPAVELTTRADNESIEADLVR